MCGIAAVIGPQSANSFVIEQMTQCLAHRGPDASGTVDAGGAWLGHRRLSIIDLTGGAQPMANEDRTVWVVFNGEIYNFPALRKLLQERGHVFQSHSDTEVIIHLYER